MSQRSYTKAQRKAFAEQLRTRTTDQVARDAQRSPATIRQWGREFKVLTPSSARSRVTTGPANPRKQKKRLSREEVAQRNATVRKEHKKQAQRRQRRLAQIAADPHYHENTARKLVGRKSSAEKMHLEKTAAGKPTMRAQKAQANFEQAVAYHEKVTDVRINARTHPVLYRQLRHEAGWTKKALPDMDHRDYVQALSRFMSDDEKELAQLVYNASWGDVLQTVLRAGRSE